MSKLNSAAACEGIVQDLLLADYPRARNRAAINSLFNGSPPYTEDEEVQNNISVNVNDLSATHIDMAARGQFGNALIMPDPLVNIELDYGPVWKRREWADRITREANKILKGSLDWLEEEESTFASVVLHGVGPAIWPDKEKWCPTPKGIEDILIPSNTLRSLKNLPFFAVYQQYTGDQMRKMTSGPNVDPGWNMPMVKKVLDWVDNEAFGLLSANWPETLMPEKWSETIKESSGLYATDRCPTIDTYHIYYWSDEGKNSGWRKKVILDMWAVGPGGVGTPDMNRKDRYGVNDKDQFLYNPGKRKYADKLDEVAHFQFGDASAVAPFRYHSVRSLGFLLYAVCHLQNRLKCRFNEATFESLMQYFRCSDPADAERVTKIDLINRGVIPDGVNFMPQQERWKTDITMAEASMQMNRQTMAENSASFTQGFDFEKEKAEETATRTMAKVNSTSALIGSMLNRAYNYQKFKFVEIVRRLCIKNSSDPDTRRFRVECLKAGVPEEALNPERLNVQPVRVIGNGNKMLQVAMADKLMATVYDKVDPQAQNDLKRLFIAVNSGDWDLAQRLTPNIKHVSDTVHDSQLTASALLRGDVMTPRDGVNHQEVIETMLHSMAVAVQRVESNGSMAEKDEIVGLNNLAQYISQQIKKLAQDKLMKSEVKKYGDDLGKLMNLVKAYAQRLQQQQQDQNQSGQLDPKDAAKIKATMLTAQTKSKIQSDAHAQRTAQREIQFQQQIKNDAIRHRVEIHKTDLEAVANIRRGGMKSFKE